MCERNESENNIWNIIIIMNNNMCMWKKKRKCLEKYVKIVWKWND